MQWLEKKRRKEDRYILLETEARPLLVERIQTETMLAQEPIWMGYCVVEEYVTVVMVKMEQQYE